MPEWLKEWWPAVALLGPIAFAVLSWAVRTGLASRKDLNEAIASEARARTEGLRALEGRVIEDLSALDRRTLTIEHEVRHLPTTKDFGELKDQMAKVGSTVDSTARELVSVNLALNRVEDHLLKRPS
ncbi:hypothetical protein EJV44_04610 [Ancylobacter aquaticus]|nr:hypothetical protein EJV44_04610 [Ancylobacter aquaticus]